MQILGHFTIIEHILNIFIIIKRLEHSQNVMHSMSFPTDYHQKWFNCLALVLKEVKQLVCNAKTKTIS